MITNVLLTGTPGIGKTTLLSRLAPYLCEVSDCSGFLTLEQRDPQTHLRNGFRLTTIPNAKDSVLLAGIDVPYGPRISKYRVDVKAFENFLEANHFFDSYSSRAATTVETGIGNHKQRKKLLLLDEVGKMELFSQRFQDQILLFMDDPSIATVATVPPVGPKFVQDLKSRDDACLFILTERNRNEMELVVKKKVLEILTAL